MDERLECPLCAETGGVAAFVIEGDSSLVTCRCGLRRVWPVPAQSAIDAFYAPDYYSYVGRHRHPLKQHAWDLLRDAGSARPLGLAAPARPVLRALARHQFDVLVTAGPGVRAIDVGCGHGDLLAYLRSRGCEVLGVERDERAIAAAREAGLAVFAGEVDDAPIPAEHFSDAILQHSLEHVARPRAVLSALRRGLAPQGRLHIAVPNGASAGLTLERRRWGHLSFPGHLWFFDAATLSRLLEDTGFRVVRCRHKATWGFHRSALREAVKARRGREAIASALAMAIMVVRPRRRDVLRVVAVAA